MGTHSFVIRGLFAAAACTCAVLTQAKTLQLAEVHSQGHIIVQAEQMLVNRLAEQTQNSIQIQLNLNGKLGTEDDSWKKIQSGQLDMARINLAGLAQDLSSVKLLSLPYLFRSREHMWHVLAGKFGDRIKKEAEQHGAIVLTYYDSGERSFYSTKGPIHSAKDFAGLRIRIQDSPVNKALITQLGATPVVIAYDKVPEAFRTGKIDAAENNTTSYVTSGHYKYAKYYSLDAHSSVPEVLLISKKAWTSLNPQQQKALQEAATDSSEFMKKQWAESENESLLKAKKEGVVITEKSQISMEGIESQAIKLYSKFVTNSDDLDTVVNILRMK